MKGWSEAMVRTAWGIMPIVVCPNCSKNWQWDDYYDLSVGDYRECPNCHTEIFVIEKDIEIVVKLSTDRPKD